MSSHNLIKRDAKLTNFFAENLPITSASHTTKKPSEYYLEYLEGCIISIGIPESGEELLKKLPRLAALGATIMQDHLANKRMKHFEFITLSPKERFINLQETSPDLLNRVSQYLIKSHLSIKPESLSRIRKRLFR